MSSIAHARRIADQPARSLDRLPRRLLQLYAGLAVYGASIALMAAARLGLDSWDVFHQALSEQAGWRLGRVIIGVSAVVLLLWVPLRQRPGVGTLSNVLVVGLAVDAALAVLPQPDWLPVRAGMLVAGIGLNGLATGLYIGAGLGPGPRDGLMTGLARRGISLRAARTGIELTVLATGWLLGGMVGIGTLLYAVTIGPLAHVLIPLLTVSPAHGGDAPTTQ